MKRFRKFLSLAAMLLGVLLLGTPHEAEAAFTVRITGPAVGGSPIIQTQGAGAESIMVQSIPFPALSGGNFSGGLTLTSQPLFPGGSPDSRIIDISGTIGFTDSSPSIAPQTITIELTRTGFTLPQFPGELSNMLHISAIANATVTAQSWVNYGAGGNNAFNGAAAGGELPTTQVVGAANPTGGGLVSTFGSESYSSAPVVSSTFLNGAVPSSGFLTPFSLTQLITITFTATGATVSLDYQTTLHNPAPAGLVLALAGMPALGIGAWLRRRRMSIPA